MGTFSTALLIVGAAGIVLFAGFVIYKLFVGQR
jgi:hypothetical protein